MSDLAIVIFAAGGYRSYVPLFLLCLFKAYAYDVLVFLDELPDSRMREGIKIAQRTGGRCKLIYDKKLREYPKTTSRSQQSENYRGQRFTLFRTENVETHLSKYQHVYMTDVDMLIMRESPPLLEQHIRHCEALGLPYSNFVRKGTRRMTGLHFMKAAEYFHTVTPVTDKYADLVRRRGIWAVMGGGKSQGERLLYRIINEAGIGFPSQGCERIRVLDPRGSDNVCFGPHHGLHIGLGRAMNRFAWLVRTPLIRGYAKQFGELAKRDDRIKQLCGYLDRRGNTALRAVLREAGVSGSCGRGLCR